LYILNFTLAERSHLLNKRAFEKRNGDQAVDICECFSTVSIFVSPQTKLIEVVRSASVENFVKYSFEQTFRPRFYHQ